MAGLETPTNDPHADIVNKAKSNLSKLSAKQKAENMFNAATEEWLLNQITKAAANQIPANEKLSIPKNGINLKTLKSEVIKYAQLIYKHTGENNKELILNHLSKLRNEVISNAEVHFADVSKKEISSEDITAAMQYFAYLLNSFVNRNTSGMDFKNWEKIYYKK
jgi:hypothetical protein